MWLTIRRPLLKWALASIASITLPGGTALAACPHVPTPKSFYVVTLGDSIMWGQGLPDGQKFRDLVTGWLQAQFGSTRQVIQFPTRSHSGAQITVDASEGDTAPNLPGEIPSGHPSISLQVDLTVSDLRQRGIDPVSVDLVLMDGGINDVSVIEILKPNHSTATIQRFTNAVMDKMASLLPKVESVFPCAGIVVTGYYPIVSDGSSLPELMALFGAFGAELGGTGGAVAGSRLAAGSKTQMVALSSAFARSSNTRLSSMIVQLNSSPGAPHRVVVAWPNFQSDNAYGAQNTLLWKVTDFVGPEVDGAAGTNPEPPTTPNGIAWNRARACAVANRASPKCLDASMGHPKQRGPQAYANVVLGQIETSLAPYLATRGLVENPACPALRTREGLLNGQILTAQSDLATHAKEQQDCQPGTGGEPSHKPKQCGAAEYRQEREPDTATMHQAGAQLDVVRRQKRQP